MNRFLLPYGDAVAKGQLAPGHRCAYHREQNAALPPYAAAPKKMLSAATSAT